MMWMSAFSEAKGAPGLCSCTQKGMYHQHEHVHVMGRFWIWT